MFGFIKKKKTFDLVFKERENFITLLTSLVQLLKKSDNSEQKDIVQKLLELIKQENFKMFTKLLNGIEMWGGAGAVWEVYIESEEEKKKFEQEMIRLIDLMEKTKILGKGIMPIRKIFEDNWK